jgi:cystathionine gamma-synthase
LIVDDTIGGFGNIDVFAHTDILLTSLTKSFSGYANVLGGCIVLNPLSPHYGALTPKYSSSFKNELFASDAQILLSNSQDLLVRTRRLNRNAEAMASFFQRHVTDPDSPIVNVQYPTQSPTKPNFDSLLRRSTPELPEPGYGCMLTVDFESVNMAKAFYDHCGFYPSPHLGGHVTIMLAYNMMAFGKMPGDEEHFNEIGVKQASVRFSAGLEDVEDLIDTIKDALDVAIEMKKKRKCIESREGGREELTKVDIAEFEPTREEPF